MIQSQLLVVSLSQFYPAASVLVAAAARSEDKKSNESTLLSLSVLDGRRTKVGRAATAVGDGIGEQ